MLRSLKDVITQLEPGLFKKVTGLSVKDFELLVSLGLFNPAHMNQAVFGFKRYEDASLEYIGINKHAGQAIGLYDTPVIVGTTIIYAYLLAITVFVLDFVYALVDPRVKVGG